MAIKDFFAKLNPYEIYVVCDNCGAFNKTRVPRGITVKEFVETNQCKCDNCGVTFTPKEYKTKWLK